MLVEFRESLEQRVSQYLDVGTHARQKHRQNRTVEHTKRMVGHGHQGAFDRDALEVGGLNIEP